MTATGTGSGELREQAVEIGAKALYYDIGDAYETEKTWEDLGKHVRAPYLDTVETILTRFSEAGLVLVAAAGSPVGDAGLTREQGDAVIAGLSALEHRLADHLRRRREAERCQSPDVAMYQQIIDRDRKHIAVLRALAAQGTGGG